MGSGQGMGLLPLIHISKHGLFNHDMFASLDGPFGLFKMDPIGTGYIYQVQLRICPEFSQIITVIGRTKALG